MITRFRTWNDRRKADPVHASLRFLGVMMGLMWVIVVDLLIDKINADWAIR